VLLQVTKARLVICMYALKDTTRASGKYCSTSRSFYFRLKISCTRAILLISTRQKAHEPRQRVTHSTERSVLHVSLLLLCTSHMNDHILLLRALWTAFRHYYNENCNVRNRHQLGCLATCCTFEPQATFVHQFLRILLLCQLI
jgi:hypothetical protein